MVLLIVMAAAEATAIPRTAVESTATVRIERPAQASARDWERSSPVQKRETVVKDEQGRLVTLRIVELQ